ncbi:MAG: Glycine--tRNA ligase [Phycisphaerae bacterium]|nr:Glycine--tRNA ligase [Phycisphaerae bacterium]
MAIDTRMEKIVALCRRRGFIFGSSEIYGGINGFWDYGPLGCELKRNIKDAWWNDMVRNPPSTAGHPRLSGREFQMVGVDCSIIMNPKVWEASGHVGGFSDPMVDCKECKARYRLDQLLQWALYPVQAIPSSVNTIHDVVNQISGATPVGSFFGEGEPGTYMQEYRKLIKTALKAKNVSIQMIPVSVGIAQQAHPYVESDGKSYCLAVSQVQLKSEGAICPRCATQGSLSAARQFNLMFQTYVGALQDASSVAYLRPETAQGIFANFQNVYDTSRVKIPFGIAQIGKAFRNEINPRNYTFRSREFEQMEIEFFCHPDESMLWYEFWRDARINWYKSLGIASEKLRPREQGKEELAHYSSACTDIEYLFPFSDEPQELEGVAHRGSFDLNQHGKFAKGREDAFAIFDDEAWERDKHLFESEPQASACANLPGEGGSHAPEKSRGLKSAAQEAKSQPPYKYVPHVIEPSAGADRFTLAVLTEAYSYDESRASPEFLKFHPRLAPIKAAVFPLVAKDGMPEIALPIFDAIRKIFPAQYDAKQSIGKRYARMDEAGTPFCFTIDGQTKEDGTVTVRNRDDASQVRIDKSRVLEFLRDKLGI